MMSGQIQRQSSSYRQGLVLGLTMAEIMLLLVFCLLIAIGTVLNKERNSRLATELKLQEAERIAQADKQLAQVIRNTPQLRELIERGANVTGKAPDEFWRQLIESNAVVAELERNGLRGDEARDSAAYLSQAIAARKEGLIISEAAKTKADAGRLQAIMDKIRAKFKDGDGLTEEMVYATIQRGLDTTGHRWPPIIRLSDADGHFFESGKAQLSIEFDTMLRTTVGADLLKIAKEYDVDVIEVIGHTDEQPIGTKTSNLDAELQSVLAGTSQISILRPADNAGLGLARAVSVVSVLKSDSRLSPYKILPLSGAQLIQTNERLATGHNPGDVRERRRIEIRLRKSTTDSQPKM